MILFKFYADHYRAKNALALHADLSHISVHYLLHPSPASPQVNVSNADYFEIEYHIFCRIFVAIAHAAS